MIYLLPIQQMAILSIYP